MKVEVPRVLVYCGAGPGNHAAYASAAFSVGNAIAKRGWGLVYGGHHAGLMGAVAEGCRRGGGPVLGILPDVLQGKEHPPDGIELLRVLDMHARKTLMVERASVILALPGGFGTLDELFEQLTWRAIGVHHKPVGVFDVVVDGRSYWAPLWTFVEHAVREGFVKQAAADIAVRDDDIDRLLDRLGVTSR